MVANFKELSMKLGNLLHQRNWKIAVAESCTGGLLSAALTAVSGASSWFDRGFVSYSADAKQEMLSVKNATLESYGMVSEQTVREMVEGVWQHSRAQMAVAITGYAGPKGGDANASLGTVFLAWKCEDKPVVVKREQFVGDRLSVREQAVNVALTEAINLLK
ncbi:MAG: CinA family protein [Gammaproteobacteria bacterium]|nr:CinA family protein [Gammaproteobacteria bacterium]MBU1558904.1 CinA family protein [Gammaproteobacteria bacterium]MBU1629128.1 CinA family protein [Gammaproteobacteria bacterium]MBU2545825.1 CinA family protein [Gammaproteobacteria bacterium]